MCINVAMKKYTPFFREQHNSFRGLEEIFKINLNSSASNINFYIILRKYFQFHKIIYKISEKEIEIDYI